MHSVITRRIIDSGGHAGLVLIICGTHSLSGGTSHIRVMHYRPLNSDYRNSNNRTYMQLIYIKIHHSIDVGGHRVIFNCSSICI